MFEDIVIEINGQVMTIIDFSYFNSILPTVQLWAEGVFWLFYGLYVINSVYFMARGVTLFSASLVSSGLGGGNSKGG